MWGSFSWYVGVFGVFQACVGGYFFFIFLIEIGVPLSEWQILGGPGSFGDSFLSVVSGQITFGEKFGTTLL